MDNKKGTYEMLEYADARINNLIDEVALLKIKITLKDALIQDIKKKQAEGEKVNPWNLIIGYFFFGAGAIFIGRSLINFLFRFL